MTAMEQDRVTKLELKVNTWAEGTKQLLDDYHLLLQKTRQEFLARITRLEQHLLAPTFPAPEIIDTGAVRRIVREEMRAGMHFTLEASEPVRMSATWPKETAEVTAAKFSKAFDARMEPNQPKTKWCEHYNPVNFYLEHNGQAISTLAFTINFCPYCGRKRP